MKEALGFVEVRGMASAVNIADAMLKAANVKLLGIGKARGSGWMSVQVSGDVGAIKAAAETGKSLAIENGVYISSLIIPRPADGIGNLINKGVVPSDKRQATKESQAILENPQPSDKNKDEFSEKGELVASSSSSEVTPPKKQSKK
ncbi:MAG: BMC domain-containing protein [Streptococcaceae bacterium]|jgi:microcompartment protein CcmL/EutN|nr:BMC domain-containing protein [Streptococcaceae bacterium]